MESKPDDLATIGRDVRRYFKILGAIIALFWLVAVINVALFSGSLLGFGVVPRTPRGFIGIPFHPFLHLGVAHLFVNSVGFLLLGGLVITRDVRDFWIASALGAVVAGLGTWLVGRSMTHVGASGVIFAYLGYLLATGLFDRRLGAIVLSLVVFLIWGSLLIGMLPTQVSVSWEVHVFGFAGGVTTAWLRGRRLRALWAAEHADEADGARPRG
jgi:membrane associated rhomboid family serine protease